MLTSWLWVHSPDRHRGVDVVCSNRSLGPESTSSVVNERLLIPQVHQHKKGKITLTTAENSSGEVQKIDHAPTCLLVDRSTSSTFPPDPFLAFRHHSVDNWTLLKSTSFVRSSGARESCLETERKSTGVKKKASRDLGYRPCMGVEWRRKASVDRNDCVWCVCVMTRCQIAQGNQNKMAKLPRTSLRFWRQYLFIKVVCISLGDMFLYLFSVRNQWMEFDHHSAHSSLSKRGWENGRGNRKFRNGG